MPKISIILPTYNVEKYIARALDSCINQTLKDIEIIVVDDKGQDKSIDIAKEYALKDDRIKIVDNKNNLKLFHARINGAKHASAEYIMFLDPDDELELNACEVVLNYIKNDEDTMFFGIKSIVENIEKPINSYKDENIHPKEYLKRFADFRWNLCGKLFKKEYYLNTLASLDIPYQINIAEDALATFFLSQKATKNIAISSQFLYKYYEDTSSMTKVKGKDEIVKINQAYDNVISIIKNSECKNQVFKNYYINRLEDEKYSFLRKLSKGNIFKYIYFKFKSMYNRIYMKKYLRMKNEI